MPCGRLLRHLSLATVTVAAGHASSASTRAGSVYANPDQFEPYELTALQDILEGEERLAIRYELLQRLRRLIAHRSVPDLDQWLEDAEASDIRALVNLSHRIQADRVAVVNGLTLP